MAASKQIFALGDESIALSVCTLCAKALMDVILLTISTIATNLAQQLSSDCIEDHF
jgi:hypothetical protein